MTKGKLWFLAVTAALGGFLFGFDTIVINGAEQDIQRLWGLSGSLHGWVMSAALWGTVIGSLIGGAISDLLGRKKTLFWGGVFYFVSAVWCAFANGPQAMIIARFIGGLGVGVSTIAAPVYISEISPPESRGKMTALFQFNIVFGIVVSLASNLALSKILNQNVAWRWMLGAEAFPALLFTALCPFLVESPRWLAMKDTAADTTTVRTPFWCKAMTKPILLAFLVAFFNQLSGCNAINYFSNRIFQMAGLGRDSAFLSSFGLGSLNFLATFVGLWLIDRLGRKTLLLIGGIGYLISLFAASIGFAIENGPLSVGCVFLFIAAHAVGQGTVIWVIISEVFPQRHRAAGQSLGSFTHWLFAALITLFFPMAAEKFKPSYIFAFFGAMMVLHLIWVLTMVPETKGKRLEDIRL